MFSCGSPIVSPMVSYGVSMVSYVFLWFFPIVFPMAPLLFPIVFPMVSQLFVLLIFLWFPYGFPIVLLIPSTTPSWRLAFPGPFLCQNPPKSKAFSSGANHASNHSFCLPPPNRSFWRASGEPLESLWRASGERL